MGQVLGIKFNDYGQVYYFDSGELEIAQGQHVIVSTEQGLGFGDVVVLRDAIPEGAETGDIKSIDRVATDEDLAKQAENVALARDAYFFCRRCVSERRLDMKLVDVDVFFDRGKIVFYFTAPNRVDFRELVKDLVKTYRTRIELRQIGVRHETQMIGAVGNCGMTCCCRQFLRKFAPVTIKMAKEQNLFLNPTKISGICGRLLCCLSYEQENYEIFHRNCPKIGKRYATNIGAVKVLRANLFRSSLSLIVEGGEEREVTLEEWQQLDPKRPEQPPQPPRKVEKPRKARPPRQDRDGAEGDANPAGDAGDDDADAVAASRDDAPVAPEQGASAGPDDAAQAPASADTSAVDPDTGGAGTDAPDTADAVADRPESAGKGDDDDDAIFLGKPKRPEGPPRTGGQARRDTRKGDRRDKGERKPKPQGQGQDATPLPLGDDAPQQPPSQGQAQGQAQDGEGEGSRKTGRPRRRRKRKPRKPAPQGE
ncbi:MAG: regulatory iron-sulfur-containing complex subunit RicT [Desulfovibrionaceae bacterium]